MHYLVILSGKSITNVMHKVSSRCKRDTQSLNKTHKKLCTLILSALKLHSWELLVFIDMNNYTFIEGRNFKTFLKENYAIVLHSCYIFTKKMLNMELNMMLIVPMEFAYIIHSWTLHFTTATKNAGPFL